MYAGLAKSRLQADDEIQRQAGKLVDGLTNQLDKIQALYRYASRDVRYVGVELGRSVMSRIRHERPCKTSTGTAKTKPRCSFHFSTPSGSKRIWPLSGPTTRGL